ncbi:DUF3618 domain-containing protein [uncultured Enterovirga sp.]|uniref:DUF3618 domain-containing protein n=1 Tax=uncultured Enterovirga sp. TaxID=2026352 RepID=UPI0035CA1A20
MTSLTELEADAEATRHRLHATIDRIQEKLTVSGMVDEFMGQAGVPRLETGHDFVLGLLRRHPVPVMIAAAGLGFLIYRMNQRERDVRLARVRGPEMVDVPALNDGQARVYDPDLPSRHPLAGLTGAERIGT